MKNIAIALFTLILLTGCFKEEGQLRIMSNTQNATIYIDGDKKGMTGDGYTTIILEEGDHKVRVYKEKDEEWFYEGEQDVFVGAKSSVKININTSFKPTEFRLERLAKEKKERDIRATKEKKWIQLYSKYEVFADYSTKLIWQDNIDAKKVKKQWITDANYRTRKLFNTTGDTATTYCKKLGLAGKSDWRLPTKDELEKLYERKQSLKNISSYYDWSSTTDEDYKGYAWIVGFSSGRVYSRHKNYNYFVRCVRAGQ